VAVVALSLAGSAAAKPGDLIVNQYTVPEVSRVNPHTGHVSTITSGPPISSASYVTVGVGGRLFVTDENLPGLFAVNPTSGSQHQIASAGLDGPYGLDADPRGNLVVGDYGVNQVLRVNRRTGSVHAITSGSWLGYPYGVAIDPHTGVIFVVDSGGAVDRVTPGGHRSTLASGPPFSSQLYATARSPNGTLFVTDSGTSTLFRVNPRTAAVHPVAAGIGGSPYGVTVGLDGKVYTTDYSGGTVTRVNPATGNVSPVAGGLMAPIGITVQPPKCGGKTATIVGSTKKDTLKGSRFNDVSAGLGGRDKIKGAEGNDLLCGGGGRDTLVGGPGKDELIGGGGNDRCIGDRHDVFRSC
jgi:streptogramin lyase